MEEEESNSTEDDESRSISYPVWGGTLCNRIVHGDDIMSETELMHEKYPQKGVGKSQELNFYSQHMDTIFRKSMGFREKGTEVEFLCVFSIVKREKSPEPDENYMRCRRS
jgi:hypothetical protein